MIPMNLNKINVMNVFGAKADALDEMMSAQTYISPDALMSYCQTRLRGIDDQVQSAFAKQQKDNADSSVLSDLASKFKTPPKDLDMTSTSADSDLDGMTPTQYVERAVEDLKNAASQINDPTAKQALLEQAGKLQAEIGSGDKSFKPEDFKAMTSDAVGKIQQDLNSGAELSMINLQSLMSQRQQAIQICTNLVQSLGDQCNKIAENVGH